MGQGIKSSKMTSYLQPKDDSNVAQNCGYKTVPTIILMIYAIWKFYYFGRNGHLLGTAFSACHLLAELSI